MNQKAKNLYYVYNNSELNIYKIEVDKKSLLQLSDELKEKYSYESQPTDDKIASCYAKVSYMDKHDGVDSLKEEWVPALSRTLIMLTMAESSYEEMRLLKQAKRESMIFEHQNYFNEVLNMVTLVLDSNMTLPVHLLENLRELGLVDLLTVFEEETGLYNEVYSKECPIKQYKKVKACPLQEY